MPGSSSRASLGAAASGLCVLALLYFALLLPSNLSTPRIFSLGTPCPMAPSKNAPESAECTMKVDKFTPESVPISNVQRNPIDLGRVMLGAPRRSSAVPNSEGTLAVYTVSTYSFEAHKKTKEIRMLDLKSKQSTLITNDEKAAEPHWLEENLFWLREGEKGATDLIVANADDFTDTYTAASIPGSVSDVRLEVLDKGRVALAFIAKARPDGSLYNAENEPKKHSTGRIYDSVIVRHWDKYVTSNTYAIWYGLLSLSAPHITESKGRYALSSVTNALKDTRLESPIPPFGGASDYSLSAHGLAFVARDPNVSAAFHTRSNFYYLPISSFNSSSSHTPQIVKVPGLEGASSSPIISKGGQSAAFLQMREDGYESDKNRLVLIPDLKKLNTATEVLKSDDGKGLWDRSPSRLTWSNDDRVLYLFAEDRGQTLLFKLDIPATPLGLTSPPKPLTKSGSTKEAHFLSTSSQSLLLTSSSLIDSSLYSLLDPTTTPPTLNPISSFTSSGTAFGLSESQVSSINFTGADGHDVHAWVMKPSSFSPDKKYPLAYLVHGGPQSAWANAWSTRWNPAVFAEQGYVVVAPNPTGSTGYGQDFTDAIQNSWGGRPYEDLVAGFEYVKKEMDFVDTSRAVALGASYGGYMMNWINGHPLGREFRALVCHDGVFSMANQLSSDEQYFPTHDLGGPVWKRQETWDAWDPSRFVGNWTTPELVIHNELDYRLPISEGLAAFNVLQQRGVESRFLTFADENHWVLKEENGRVWHKTVLDWINKFTGVGEEDIVKVVEGEQRDKGGMKVLELR